MSNKAYPTVPRVAAGGVVVNKNKVLLVLRGQEPSKGMWAVPGGRVELGETLQAAAEREVLEETGLHVKAKQVIYSFDAIERDENGRVKFHYVILDLWAEPLDPDQPLCPADDVDDARWFTLADLDNPNYPISNTTQTLITTTLKKVAHLG